MPSCFHPQPRRPPPDHAAATEDAAILFSTTSDSPAESTTPCSLSSSSFYLSSPPLPPPPQQSHLAVTNLSFTISPKPSSTFSFSFLQTPKPITILNSVSFTADAAQILAVVGPSGTGKSTLLRVIAGRVRNHEFDTNAISINGRRISSPSQLKKICGFVAQDDNLLPLLTVRETLMYSAKFHLKDLTVKEKEERVEGLLRELGLLHVAESYVGDESNRGISGGERKRVSIGVDLICDPPILLLDEPTSGLDSSSALQVIEHLSAIARVKRRTVIVSIHQPSYRILQFIPNFLVLSRGSVVHHGSLETLEDKIGDLGFSIPDQLNALEFAMEIVGTLEELAKSGDNNNNDSIPSESETIRHWIWPAAAAGNHRYRRHRRSIDLEEIAYLCSRFWKVIYRTKQLFAARTLQALVGGLGLGSVYVKLRNSDGSGVAERLGLFAFSLSFLLSSTVEALPIYLQERRVLMKEASRGAYRISSYLIANTIVFLPFLLAVAIIFSAPVYWIVGLNPSIAAFGFFVFTVWLIVLMASSLVMFLSAVSPNFIAGNSLICTVLGAFFLFSGYFIPKDRIPKYWMFMYYVSLYRYPLDSLLTNEYWSRRKECFRWQGGGGPGTAVCVLTGSDVLRSRGLERDGRWENVGIMVGFFVVYRVLCWIVLARKASRTTI
ncbi:unnamed protein product [Linum trigynum]|uniref:ABC transporter domain-containing protein n=1 Tax=Linum trigynum TaxID=586398 RepID=A0AAV2D2X7_9ROSI